jgi:alpha-D-xyloside xylohydrolase
MKAKSTIVELADTALPIFGDPVRDYDFLTRLRSVEPAPGGLLASVESYEEATAQARFSFLTPEILRVQYYRDQPPPEATPMLAGPLPAPPSAGLTEGDAEVTIACGALRLELGRDPFGWRLLDGAGRVIAQQELHDGALDEHVSMPAGWSHRPGEPPDFHETLSLRPDEQLYGLGESFAALNRRGTRAVSWSRDTHGTSTTPLTYLNIPFFISTRGYGVFINQTSRIVYELGWPSQIAASLRVEDPYLDYFLIYGPEPKAIIERYWSLTGRAALPPLWSFGVWMSRCMYRDAEQVRGVVERMRELDLPLDVIHVDPRWLAARNHHERDGCDFAWARDAFGEPEEFIDWLRARHVRLSLWENPYVWRDTEAHRELSERGLLATAGDGKPAPSLDNPREADVIDFTNPEGYRWWQDRHRPLLRAGVAAFKPDYGEGVPADARFSDGSTGRQTHNVYPLLYNRAVWEVMQQETGEPFLFSRSGYAGSQRYPLNWVGDTQSTWEGMAAALRAGLSLSMSGIAFWAHDIGGFYNPANIVAGPDPALYIRWAQWGLLSSHSRFHGIRGREPWWYGDEAIDIVRQFSKLRHRLLPYLWSCARDAVGTATPVVRPMVLEWPHDPTTWQLDSQYMLGPSLLVAPVFDPDGRVRVYLPAGRWFDLWSNEAVDGPCWLDLRMPLDRLPVYVRDDSLLPFGPEQTYVGEHPWQPLDIDVRVSSQAGLRVEGEGVALDARAVRDGEGVALTLSGSGEIALRFLSPAVAAAEASGGVQVIETWTTDGVLNARLQLDGDAEVRAR